MSQPAINTNDLVTRNKQLEEEVKARHRQTVSLTEQVQKLEEELSHSKKNASEQGDDNISELQQKIKQLEKSNVQLLEKNQNDVYQWKIKEKKYNEEITKLQGDLANLQLSMEGMSKIQDKSTDTTELQNLIHSLKNELNGKNDEIENLKNQIQQMKNEDPEEKQKMLQELAKKHELEEELSKKKLEFENLQQRSQKWQQEQDEFQKKLNEISLENQNNHFQLTEAQKKLSSLEALQFDSKNEIASLEDQLRQTRQQLSEKQQESNSFNLTIKQLKQKITIVEKEFSEQQQKFKTAQDEYKEDMNKLIKVNERQIEKSKLDSENQMQKLFQLEQERNQLKKEYTDYRDNNEMEKTNFSRQIVTLQKTLQETKKLNLDLEYKLKDMTKALDDRTKLQIKQLEQLKNNENELKQAIGKIKALQEQLQNKEDEFNRVNQVKNKLIQDNQEIKSKTESQNDQITKLKSTVVQDLKKQLQDKEQEIILIKEVVKSTKIMIKVKDNDIARIKQRNKQLEQENLDLLNKCQNFEGIFQDILQTSKNKHAGSPLLKNSKVNNSSATQSSHVQLPLINSGQKQKQLYNQQALLGRKEFLSHQDQMSDKSNPLSTDSQKVYAKSEIEEQQQNHKEQNETFKKPVQVNRKKIIDASSKKSDQSLQSILENQPENEDSLVKTDKMENQNILDDQREINQTNNEIKSVNVSKISEAQSTDGPTQKKQSSNQQKQPQINETSQIEENNYQVDDQEQFEDDQE